MDTDRCDDEPPRHCDEQGTPGIEFTNVAQAFLELFRLLEEYAPVWYTEQHHKNAVVAQRLLVRAINAKRPTQVDYTTPD